ncbi:ATP-binding protein [Algoriphagus litoralis]|uniref:ATP-binding protein n=1 Tax=Algoriphagus litoralis TaxID=2202829 RepID=UPI0018E4FED5|nr:ATP-binding protein [Algoriphagus litoralis]
MKPFKSILSTGKKVAAGFSLATFILISVAGLTYFSLNQLEDSVRKLAQPNQKLELLNDLQSDIFRITRLGVDSLSLDGRVNDTTISQLQGKLDELDTLASDSLERRSVQTIRDNLAVLINGYVDLYEVKKNLTSRNFSQEALNKVEVGIRRRAQNLEYRPLRELNPKNFIYNELQEEAISRQEQRSGVIKRDEDQLIAYLRKLRDENSPDTEPSQSLSLDSVLYSLRGVINQIYKEESSQRQKLAMLETSLSQKQNEIGITVQNLIRDLQSKAILASNEQSAQASGLVFDVSFFLLIVVVIAIVGTGFLVYSVLKEIRLNKSYQEDLETSRRKSDQLAKSKQEFLANMSHEIRNPLHVIQGYRAILDKSDLEANQKSHLKMIGFASDTLMEIVNDILDFSRLEAGKLSLDKEPFDPFRLFGAIQSFFELTAKEKKLEFRWDLDLPEGQWLVGDELRIKQVMNNLLGNAFKFTQDGSVNVSVSWTGGQLELVIRDTGIGMTAEELSKVFQEFDQADASVSRKFGGTGLGLAIVQRLVNLMKGSLFASSEKGKGTTMRVVIPTALSPAETEERTEETEKSIDLSGLRILLIDDDRVGLKYLETVLTYFGAEVVSYPGGKFFRDEFQSMELDLAMIDIQMPEFSGFDVAKSIRNFPEFKDLPLLAMTANVFVEEKERMFQEGFNELILKPFQEEKLIATLGGIFPERVESKSLSDGNEALNSELFSLTDMDKFCMGDQELLADIVRDLIRDTEADLQKITRARLNNRWQEILEICHQLGSRLGQIKSPAGPIARRVENNLKLNHQQGIQETLNSLDMETKKTLAALKEKVAEIV